MKPSMFDGGERLQFQKTPFIPSDSMTARTRAANVTAYLRTIAPRSTHFCTKNASKQYWHVPLSVDRLISFWEFRGVPQRLEFAVVNEDGSFAIAGGISGAEWLAARTDLQPSPYGGWLWE